MVSETLSPAAVAAPSLRRRMARPGVRRGSQQDQGVAILFVLAVLRRDWRFLAITIISCGVATTVATFQYAVFNSFRHASAVIPRMVEADYWVSAASVESFDFPTPFAEDHAAILAQAFPEGSTRRIVFGFAPWRSPSGRRGNVALVGIENLHSAGVPVGMLGFVANHSDLARLDLADPSAPSSPVEATVGHRSLQFAGTVDSLSTYLGAPYLLVELDTARAILGLGPTDVSFVAGTSGLAEQADIGRQLAVLNTLDPEIVVRSAGDFATSSADYWMRKTGAGLAIGLAAVLASLLTVILLSNGVLRFVQRYFADLVSLLGHGAAKRDIAAIIRGITLVVAVVTLLFALLVTPVMVFAFQPLLPWVAFTPADLAAPLAATLLSFAVALLSARTSLAGFAPDAVFRT